MEVSSVSYEQIRVGFIFVKNAFMLLIFFVGGIGRARSVAGGLLAI